ncbi:Phospholipase YtpA [Pigmentiphaga humi]|uniref:Phospholipase YtpA n=1 Tax=Pigmentiphaga humi TaxID=2478468 RepID=A0A3P4AXL1_9BURK|nr:alpha/beta hydrolase [Pigmentiphaga humi]VCU68271.1 Phospholipase YtpA [Pigmentiphaga humi]
MSLISMTTAPDGTQLAAYRWDAPRPPGLRPAYLLHGLGEHAGRYEGLARWLAARGWSAAAHDHRGHGRSAGKRGALRTQDDLVVDAEHRLGEYLQETGAPPLLIGHGLGGLVAARVALRGRAPLAGLALSSPAFGMTLPARQRWLLDVLGSHAPNLRVRSRLKLDKLTHEQAVVDAYAQDPLVHDRVSARLMRFIAEAGEQSIAEASRLAPRTLLMVAGADTVVPPAGSRRFADHAAPGKLALRWYHQAFHDVLHEAPELATPVYADFDAWLATLSEGV